MQTDQYKEYMLVCLHEPPDGGTQRWEKTGKGDGQQAYAEEKTRWPRAEITIYVRDVVRTQTSWKKVAPDSQCSGSGFSHSSHGECHGYATDRT